MGRDKAFLPLPPDGAPLIIRQAKLLSQIGCDELLISGRPGVAYRVAGARVVTDPGPASGPLAGLAALLDQPVLLLGSAKEEALCDDIAKLINQERPKSARNLAGLTDLSQAMALIASSQAMLSNDSGLMHVAAAMGVPQVAVFGSSSPLHTPPLSDKAVVLWLKNEASYQPPLDCAPCFERSCPLGHLRCLNDLTPERVDQAWREVVSG
jgi:heptosyltransferase-2